MSDVRDELRRVVVASLKEKCGADSSAITDAILARWDLIEKPVVSVEDLGRMTITAGNWPSLDFSCAAARERSHEIAGMRLLDQLTEAGLTIVRSGEGASD